MLMNKLVQLIKAFKKNPRIFILDGVVVILAIFLVIISISATGEIIDGYHAAAYKEESFYYRLEEGSYPEMVRMYHLNEAAGRGDAAALQEYYGVAKYFEAATNYKVYLSAGETEKAAAEKKKMDAAYEQMGDFGFVSEKIQTKLGLN